MYEECEAGVVLPAVGEIRDRYLAADDQVMFPVEVSMPRRETFSGVRAMEGEPAERLEVLP
jgi:hypothetical protein